MTAVLRIAGNAARVGFEDTRAQFTWKSWLFGWMVRTAAFVLFYAAMGLMVGGETLVLYAFVGNTIAQASQHALGSGPDTAWERALGTLPLLVAAPRSMLPVFAGRSSFYMAQGLAESTIVFLVLAPFLGFSGHWWLLPLGLAVVSLGSYGLGLFLAAISIRRPRIGNILFNAVFYTLVAIGGVNVATRVFPGWVQVTAGFLPLYHGLLGSRSLLAGGVSSEAMGELGLELLIGVAWFVLAMAGFYAFAEGGRRDGSIDLAE
jgi:ABC-type polysaccharide/polyol phosphate export permease